MALLCLLGLLQKKYRLRLVAAHLHHGFIQKESDRYQTYVRRFCQQKGIPFYSRQTPVKKIARRTRRSLEETGRIERYAFLREIARKTRSNKIVTAHTLEDQAETMLMRILRGSGLTGLTGIPYKRREGDCLLIRPLLGCRKKELIHFLHANRVYYFEDKTNRDTTFYRNRVRRHLLPGLERHFNPAVQKSLASLQEACQEAQDYFDQISLKAFKRCAMNVSPRRVSLNLDRLARLHPALLGEVLRKAAQVRKKSLRQITRSHITAIADLLKSPVSGLEVQLPGGLRVRKADKSLDFVSK